MDSSLKIAVLCFYFPPMNSVGGRRWSKFAKYFSRNSISIVFFTEDPERYHESEKNISWVDDSESKYTVIRINSGYPAVVNAGPKNIWQKIRYRFSILSLKKRTQGNIYDPSSLWNDQMHKIIAYLQQNDIKKIVVSGAPFAYMYYALEVKKKIPDVKLIADFRDLWADSLLGYGKHVLNYQGKLRYETERKRQSDVLHEYDHLVTVSEDIKFTFCDGYKISAEKITVIPNGFDPEEGFSSGQNEIRQDKKVKFLYFGTINCSENYYGRFVSALKRLAEKDEGLFLNSEFVFVGNTNISFSNALNYFNHDVVKQLPRMPLREMLEFSKSFDFMLYFKMENDLKNSFGTKFFDYLRFRKPIVMLSPEGEVTKYLREKNIGCILNEEDVYTSLKELMINPRVGIEKFDATNGFEEFNIEMLSKKYTELLDKI